MLSSLITKEVELRIITFLITKEGSLSSIAKETKTTKANSSHALKELEKKEIVRKSILGKTHIYRFNFLHPQANQILKEREETRRKNLNLKLKNIPSLIHTFLSFSVKEYEGCIFFGSSITERNYNDIDVGIILKEKKKDKEMTKKLKFINPKITPIYLTSSELKKGINQEEMIYKNIIKGIYFGKKSILKIKYQRHFLKRKDIKERFILGYGDLLSCLEFKEKEYTKTHLERGSMNFIYSLLNYFEKEPKNDKEAIKIFQEEYKEQKPKTVASALKLSEKYAWIL